LAAAVGTNVTAITAPVAGGYNAGDELVFQVRFSGPVQVTGQPVVNLTVGKTILPATYVSGTGTNTLAFKHVVAAGENDADGITVGKSIVLPPTAAIVDGSSKAVALGLKPVNTAKVIVDTAAPVITSVIGPAAKTYKIGSTLTFTVKFSEKVFVEGVPPPPLLPITVGTTQKFAVWNGKGNGGTSLTFNLPVQVGDSAPAGVRVGGPLVFSGGATIRDAAGNNANPAAAGVFPKAIVNAVGPGRTFATAVTVPLNSFSGSGIGSAQGTIQTNGFLIYKVVAPRGAFLWASAMPAQTGSFNPIVRIWNAAGAEVGSRDWSGSSTYVPAGAGTATYFLGVSDGTNVAYDAKAGTSPAVNQSPAGSYSLSVNTVRATNLPPTGISLAGISLEGSIAFAEGMPGRIVSEIDVSDPNQTQLDILTCTLVAGEGDADNAKFTIDKDHNVVRSASVFSLGAGNWFADYSIRIRATDTGGQWFEKPFAIRVVKNEPPTDIKLLETRFVEGMAVGTVLTAAVVTDINRAWARDTYTYALVAGGGDTDNARFSIDQDGLLRSAQRFQVSSVAAATYSVRIRVTDGAGGTVEKPFTITVEQNVAPTDILLGGGRFLEGLPKGSEVDYLDVVDANKDRDRGPGGDTFTWALVPGVGGTDNARFTLEENGFLDTAQVFSVNGDTNYSIRVKVTDGVGHTFEKPFTITVVNNLAPTDILLENNRLLGGEPVDTLIDALYVTDPNGSGPDASVLDSFTFALVAGPGDTDNSKFKIYQYDNQYAALLSAQVFSVTADKNYSVRIRVTDRGGLTYEKRFSILVTPPNLTEV